MTVEDVESGMVLHWQSETWPNKKSRWIVLEELEHASDKEKRFNIFCMYSTAVTSSGINQPTTYIFHNENIHRFSIHSQI
jgi:hypothetical protein